MLEKWVLEIGFGSTKSLSKYLLWQKLGYYIPKIPLKGRLKLLNNIDNTREDSQAAKASVSVIA